MKSIIFLTCLYFSLVFSQAQELPTPAKLPEQPIALTHATIHVGDGSVIKNGTILFSHGVIVEVGPSVNIPKDAQVIDCTGKQIYPGLIAINTRIGLTEISSVRATKDFWETGGLNPNVRSIIAYNTDSKVTPTVRSNGILMAQVAPEGWMISGSSSVVQLDAWNWEDASYKVDDGLYLTWPASFTRSGWWAEPGGIKRSESYIKSVNNIREYFEQAQAYYSDLNPDRTNLRFEGMKGVFSGDKKLYILVDQAKDMISAVRFAQDFGVTPVIVGGAESYKITPFLKENKVPIVLNALHRTPDSDDEGIFVPYELPKILKDEGVEFALTYVDYWQVRNLPFQAGTAVAYGLDYEEAVKSVTLSAAKILGIDQTAGSLEIGKDATIVVSTGDLLDMKTSQVVQAFIQGRAIDLGNKQKDLYKKFAGKYGQEIVMP